MQMACHSISLGSDTQYNNRRYKIVTLGLMWKLMSMIKCYAVSTNTGIERKFTIEFRNANEMTRMRKIRMRLCNLIFCLFVFFYLVYNIQREVKKT